MFIKKENKPKGNLHHRPEFLDIPTLEKALDLRNEAQRTGEKNQPSASVVQLSGTEATIEKLVSEHRIECKNWCDWQLDLAQKNFEDLNLAINLKINEARELPTQMTQDVKDVMAGKKSILENASQQFKSKTEELADFKEKNQLKREAKILTKRKSSILYMFLGCGILFESLLNASFFAAGSDSGLIGGFGFAFIFAFLNVLFSEFQGRVFLPLKNHVNIVLKMIGWLLPLLAIFSMCLIALAVSHYRDAMVQDLTEPAKYALYSIKTTPFTLNDINSYILAAITIVFGFAAYISGYNRNDPYPKYGKLFKGYKESKMAFEMKLNGVIKLLESCRNDRLEDLDKLVRDLNGNLTQQETIIRNKEFVQSTYQNYISNEEKVLNALIQTFRTENRLHRTDPHSVPDYFNHPVELAELKLKEEYDSSKDRESYRQNEQRVKDLIEEVEPLKQQIMERFEQGYQKLLQTYEIVEENKLNEE